MTSRAAGPTYSTTLVPVREENGRIVRLIGVTRDFTERNRAEEREREHEMELFQAAKLGIPRHAGLGHRPRDQQPEQLHPPELPEPAGVLGRHPAILDDAASKEGALPMHGIPYETARGMVDDLLGGIGEGSKRIEKLLLNLRDFARGDEGALTR